MSVSSQTDSLSRGGEGEMLEKRDGGESEGGGQHLIPGTKTVDSHTAFKHLSR